MSHDFDPLSYFCIRCGMAAQQHLETEADCIDDDTNVVAVSHLIARRRMAKLIGAFWAAGGRGAKLED